MIVLPVKQKEIQHMLNFFLSHYGVRKTILFVPQSATCPSQARRLPKA